MHVFAVMWRKASRDNEVPMTVRRLAKLTGLSRATIKRALRHLRAERRLRVIRRGSFGGPSVYRLTTPGQP